ncbi:RES domain-containing protein [Curtobacterium sp. MCBD17_040]|uniref:RES domain-containing protein n=1 Tax=Curtobacterium sp. MCBD17_040 TaxID=2175674 RepID=UPI0011B64BF3|nr:RES domain-containing protein [Curtobacterium sp. MCBD17_040]WIB65865.1 RES domain-containing protein [Curtobacterium sp. MCBD17_040]
MADGELTHSDYALCDPSDSLNYADFPTREAPPMMFRAKAKSNSAWYFSSVTAGSHGKQNGRFDLPAPRGTCYWAADAATALRERLGPNLLAEPGSIPQYLLDAADIASADGAPGAFADLGSPDAVTKFGVTGELSKTADYVQARKYALVFDAAGLAGIFYGARFSGDQPPNALAIFGDQGADPTRQVDPATIPALTVARQMGLTVIPAPAKNTAAALNVLDPTTIPAMKRRDDEA